jgi:hypothetical protein
MSEKQSIERNRVYSYLTRSRFLHVEDALAIGKLRLFVGKYKRGKGASSTAFHFLDVDDARVLLSDLAWSKPVDFVDYKGTSNGDPSASPLGKLGGRLRAGGPQSRVLTVKTNGEKVWVEIKNGPGELVGEGAVKPKGKPDAAVSVPLSTWEARKLAFAVLAYVRAWEARHLLVSISAGEGQRAGKEPAPSLKGENGSQPPVATKRADPACPEREPEVRSRRMANGVTTGREVEHTPTGFWSLFNTEGRAAGVEYPLAQEIANGAGDDWRKAILELCAAIDDASAEALD